jgi:hypothetical protein
MTRQVYPGISNGEYPEICGSKNLDMESTKEVSPGKWLGMAKRLT